MSCRTGPLRAGAVTSRRVKASRGAPVGREQEFVPTNGRAYGVYLGRIGRCVNDFRMWLYVASVRVG